MTNGKIIEIKFDENFDFCSKFEYSSFTKDNSILIYLGGDVIENHNKIIIDYFKENWDLEKDVIFFNPVVNNNFKIHEKYLKLRHNCFNKYHIIYTSYYSDFINLNPYSFYELGRVIEKNTTENFPYESKHKKQIFLGIHNSYPLLETLCSDIKISKCGVKPILVNCVTDYAKSLFSYIKNNFQLYRIEMGNYKLNCTKCKNFNKDFEGHTDIIHGFCLSHKCSCSNLDICNNFSQN